MITSRNKLVNFDAFAKTVEDARIRTTSGGIVTLVCFILVVCLIINDWNEFRTIVIRPELVVDRDRAKRLDINVDITFPNLPCDLLTLDIMDVSGELQLDVAQYGFKKIRLDLNGKNIASEDLQIGSGESYDDSSTEVKPNQNQNQGSFDDDQLLEQFSPEYLNKYNLDHDYCGPCFGAKDQSNNEKVENEEEKVCCQTCKQVKEAYAANGWAFFDGSEIEQCEREGYVTRINERLNEGCRIYGKASINRIAGNLHFAPGASHSAPMKHIHDLSLFDKTKRFSFNHVINHFSFGEDPESSIKASLNRLKTIQVSSHPLDGFKSLKNERYHLYSHYLKVVSTRYEFLNSTVLETNQFSSTFHDRPLKGGKDEDHPHTLHAKGGIPGLFFHFDISPLKIINREQYAKSWGSFLLSVCSAVGGVLAVGAVIDRTVWEADKVLRRKKDT
ncbi:retrograde cargo receptor ERV46 [Ascoidea rubescens DSM 1968]|uniref:Endoplasmic reticulum-Golgi intermediate compartment protein n=1 Tax=Ascoidea rubescens DSM 1968 TaxID=1344418 RepID=A0A1D2VCL9_9ASCO|nr:DUF1692-domain-containing protein [Ascoidea rubescens DSM 1968]ODV59250.1 DUF1692-domain-containing protein [Ascoidea rubescens DSM 1968]